MKPPVRRLSSFQNRQGLGCVYCQQGIGHIDEIFLKAARDQDEILWEVWQVHAKSCPDRQVEHYLDLQEQTQDAWAALVRRGEHDT